METISTLEARRVALFRAGLLPGEKNAGGRIEKDGERTGAGKSRPSPLDRSFEVIRQFGYLQLDTVSIAGARSHSIVLVSRIPGLDSKVGEELLRPGAPIFEYWGHEVSWIPLELYPYFEFRRKEFRRHPWWGDVLSSNKALAREILARIRSEGPLRSSDWEGPGSRGWWNLKPAKRVLAAYWSSGELAVRERRNFQRIYDLSERVIPSKHLTKKTSVEESLRTLLLLALQGQGWAQTGTLASTWRLRNRAKEIAKALETLVEDGEIVRCALVENGKRTSGWIRPTDLDRASELAGRRMRRDRGILLSPFDPLIWDRARVQRLFGFAQVLEIFKPAPQRVYGYYCLPVLAGDQLVGRVDLKADRKSKTLRVLSIHIEESMSNRTGKAAASRAMQSALERYAKSLRFSPPSLRGAGSFE